MSVELLLGLTRKPSCAAARAMSTEKVRTAARSACPTCTSVTIADIRAWRDQLWLWCRPYRLPPDHTRAVLTDVALNDLEDYLESGDEAAAEAAVSFAEALAPDDGAPLPVGALTNPAAAFRVDQLVHDYQAVGEPYERLQSPLTECRKCGNLYAPGPAVVRWAESEPLRGRPRGFPPGEPWEWRKRFVYEQPYTDLAERRAVYLALVATDVR